MSHAKNHNFLGAGQDESESRTWLVIYLCSLCCALEVGFGLRLGSVALMADGVHMSTHAAAFLASALAYRLSKKHLADPRFVFGTAKMGDLGAFCSGVVLLLITGLIFYEAVSKVISPQETHFAEAAGVATVGLAVNVLSGLIMGGCFSSKGVHAHEGRGHDHGLSHGHSHGHQQEAYDYDAEASPSESSPLVGEHSHRETHYQSNDNNNNDHDHDHAHASAPLPERKEASLWSMLSSLVYSDEQSYAVDQNFRATLVHVVADAFVSVLVIAAVCVASLSPALRWVDPAAGVVGACVILSWAVQLSREAGANLLDMQPDPLLADRLRRLLESDGSTVTDLHVWRLGPGNLGAVVSMVPPEGSARLDSQYYHERIRGFRAITHATIEVLYR